MKNPNIIEIREVKKAREAALEDIVAWRIHELRSPLTIAVGASSYLKEFSGRPIYTGTSQDYAKMDEEISNFLHLPNDELARKYSHFIKEVRRSLEDIGTKLVGLDKLEHSEGYSENADLAAMLQLTNDRMKEMVDIFGSKGLGKDNIYGLIEYLQKNVNMDPRVDKKRLSVSHYLSPDLQGLEVNAPEFRNIYTVLAGNALDAAGPMGKVRTETYLKSDHVKISVSDNGRGIPKNIIQRLGEKNFSHGKGKSGTGVGLYSVKQILQRYSGTLSVYSEVNKGTKIIASVPLMSIKGELDNISSN